MLILRTTNSVILLPCTIYVYTLLTMTYFTLYFSAFLLGKVAHVAALTRFLVDLPSYILEPREFHRKCITRVVDLCYVVFTRLLGLS